MESTPGRRNLNQPAPTPGRSWEERILKHLSATNRWDYGCLNKAGELFTILSLTTVNVPRSEINKLISNKQIALGEDDYYKIVNN